MTGFRNIAAGAALLALAAAPAAAGGMAEPIDMAPVEIIADTAGGSSSAGLIVPLILIALLAAAKSGGSDSGSAVLGEGGSGCLGAVFLDVVVTADFPRDCK